MSKFIFVGDLHYRGTNPESRIDDYKATFNEKIAEIYDLARRENVEAILTPGDVFESHTVAISTLLELHAILENSPVPWHTIIGNHDLIGYNLNSFERSSLKILSMLSSKLKVIGTDELFPDVTFKDVTITGTHYDNKMDVNGYGYDPEWLSDDEFKELNGFTDTDNSFKIHLSHGMLLDHVPPFDRYTLIDDVKTTANLVLCGHDHTGFGVAARHKKANSGYLNYKDGSTPQLSTKDYTIFCNPGALMRSKASQNELQRTVQVALINIQGKQCQIDLIPLQSAKKGHEVLSRQKLEERQERQYAMDQFSALIESRTGEKVLLDTLQIVQELAVSEGLPAEVVEKTLRLIEKRRENNE